MPPHIPGPHPLVGPVGDALLFPGLVGTLGDVPEVLGAAAVLPAVLVPLDPQAPSVTAPARASAVTTAVRVRLPVMIPHLSSRCSGSCRETG
jgi:hypothetical protein